MLVLKVEKDALTLSQYRQACDAVYVYTEFADMLFFHLVCSNEVVEFARVQITDVTIVKSSCEYDVQYCKAYEEVKRAKDCQTETANGAAARSPAEIAWPSEQGELRQEPSHSSQDAG